MEHDTQTSASKTKEQHPQPLKIQIYPPATGEVSSFWKEKYDREAKKYWEIFYKRHQDKFFKDRHYLDKEWGHYFSGAGGKVILEVGCGAGNTVYPLLATYHDIFVHACDFSPRAVNLVKARKDFEEARINAFVCDLTADDLCQHIAPSSVDIVTMIFVLSAVTPEKMSLVLQNIRKVLKRDGFVLFRDYATGDLAQERLISKEQKISDNFYVRGDGTAFYFSDEFLTNLFKENGFDTDEHFLCLKKVENRSREIVMNRRWVQAVFHLGCGKSDLKTEGNVKELGMECPEPAIPIKAEGNANEFDIDISEGIAFEMFGISSSSEEVVELNINELHFKINVVSREYQHTCKSTGLMLWESARFMASVLSENPRIVSGKRVLELGCGCAGICSMVAASKSAQLVVATDGDSKALDLLNQNINLNLKPSLFAKLITMKLEWGNKDDIDSIRRMNDKGFDIILGTDVAYVLEAILPLFETARELICHRRVDDGGGGAIKDEEPAGLILCHVRAELMNCPYFQQHLDTVSSWWTGGLTQKPQSLHLQTLSTSGSLMGIVQTPFQPQT